MSTETKQTRKKRQPKKQEVKSQKKKTNYWRLAFLLLVGLLLGTALFLGMRVTQTREDIQSSIPQSSELEGNTVLSVNATKEQINQLIAHFLEDYQEGSDITYNFYLENQALLNGTFKVLGYPIEFYLYFDPYVMDNGNIQLKAKSLSIGTLGLPIKEILNFVKKEYKLPQWVEVNPKDSTILLRLDQFKMQNGLYIRAEKINLVEDEIEISVYIPTSSQEEAQ